MTDKIDEFVAARHAQLGREGDLSDKWGLALSGGGIRSATFCFGLLSVLARNRLLERFDLLSTVSGGGYIGAMLGRLLQRTSNTDETRTVFDSLAHQGPRWFRWWLRANGRYLVPRGPADRTFAFAVFLRNLLAIHLELGAMALLLGVLLAGLNVTVWATIAAWVEPTRIDSIRWLSPWLPTLWLTVIPPIAVAAALSTTAYWVVPWVARAGRPDWLPGFVTLQWIGLLIGCGVLLHFRDALVGSIWQPGYVIRLLLLWGAVALAIAWLIAIPLARFLLRPGLDDSSAHAMQLREEAVRRWLADWQAWCMKAIGVVLLAGLVDRTAWFLAFEFDALADTALVLAIAAAALRAAAPVLGSVAKGGLGEGFLLTLGRAAGYLLTFLLCTWWASLVYASALGPMFSYANAVDFTAALPMLLGILAAAGLYVLATGRNFEFLNLSSLHTFYRARLVRSYLGAANPARFCTESRLGAIESLSDTLAPPSSHKSVFSPHRDDDIPMESYCPHRHGGPVHMIGVCINQTHDPRGGLFNRDRRGLPLTVGPLGWVRVGLGAWEKVHGRGALSLGSWVAISGAAVAPGLGSQTNGGLSALLAFAGVRLGYWWTHAARKGTQDTLCRIAAKSRGLLSEVFGNFKGSEGPNWFLTDGGHFENTAAYALLAERCRLIVVADCGADPKYHFGDLENLVRKARIDLGAEIEFLRPLAVPKMLPPDVDLPAGLAVFGSLNDLASGNSNACLALGKVRYLDDGEPGWLILVKPNISAGLPVDLINFAASNPDFPQQTTADQFFDEAQWESYYQLGFALGEVLDEAFVDTLRTHHAALFEPDTGAFAAGFTRVTNAGKPAAGATDAAISRLPERIRNTAVGATIGIGAAGTVLLSTWQAVGSVLDTQAKERETQRIALKKISEEWSALPGRDQCSKDQLIEEPSQLTSLASTFMHYADALCADSEADWLEESDLVKTIYDEVVSRCKLVAERVRSGACVTLLTAKDNGDFHEFKDWPEVCFARRGRQSPPFLSRQAYYWAYRYVPGGKLKQSAHPCDPRAHEHARAEEERNLLIGQMCEVEAPAPHPEPSQPNAAASTTPGSTDAKICSGVTIYIQIYGPDLRDTVRDFRESWRELGASVPPIEDVVATARNKQRPPPRPVAVTTVRYHDPQSMKCADQLGPRMNLKNWKVEALSTALKPTPGVVEVWIGPEIEPKEPKAP